MAQRRHIWQQPGWPSFQVDGSRVASSLSHARREQGILLGQAKALGISEVAEVTNDLWVEEAIATAAIEGQNLHPDSVRSSVMRRLGLKGGSRADRHTEGLVEVMQDATLHFDKRLVADRLCRWQSALFPGGTSGIARIQVGKFRTSPEPMQIVGGLIGKEAVYYTAPPASALAGEMRRFLKWFEDTRPRSSRAAAVDGIARAAIAHLWFETIHPFEDGNGRIGRAIIDLALAQDTGGVTRIYSVSRQLMQERKAYYKALGEAQHGSLEITDWVQWFVEQFAQSCLHSQAVIGSALAKSKFWSSRVNRPLTDRQRKVVQRLLDAGPEGFSGGMSAEKYVSLTKVSKATSTRDLADLLLNDWVYATGQGKSTRYWLNVPEWRQ